MEAFRRRLERTFKISEEENEDFCPVKEREVGRWMEQHRQHLRKKRVIRMEDTPTISEELVREVRNN